ncbi:MAG: glycosyltransferase [Candidatus Melainabacteria bacterium]|nr:glycosyltransferase [Candidatus Melainabacteria bacterium]
MPKVSVVVPSYNRADYISETIESILAQTFKDFELIFIDDGSTDKTEELVKAFASQDERVKYFKQKNSERAVARSYGMSLASADLICLIDSDDLWYPNKLELQVARMEADPELCCCYASVDRIDLESKPVKSAPRQQEGYSGNIYEKLLERNFIPSVTPMIRKKYIEMVGSQVTEFIPYEDWDFWLRLARIGKFEHLTDILGSYRLHPGQSVQNVKPEKIEEVTLKVLDANRPTTEEAYSLAYLRCAYWYIIAGDLRYARKLLRRSMSRSSKRSYDYRWWALYLMSFVKILAPGFVDNLLGSFH